MIAEPGQILRQVFGYAAFRPQQAEIVAHVMAGGSGLVLMPTGGGKSLCFQVPALCMPGLAVVVSPLIALMEDQVAALRQQGVAAAALHSDIDDDAGLPSTVVNVDVSNHHYKLVHQHESCLSGPNSRSNIDHLRAILSTKKLDEFNREKAKEIS